MKTNNKIIILIIILIITISFFIQNNLKFINQNNNININFLEVNTEYENNDSYDLLSYIDTSWKWPTDSNYYLTSNYSNYHPAIDIVSNNTNNIYSAYSGTVVTSSYKSDNGNYLIIKQDNGYYTLYAHLSKKLVVEGQNVSKGELIGIMGSTGYATGVHLHFAVWENYPYQSNSINPQSFYY